MIEVTFNGVELTQYITVLDSFTLWAGADFDPQYTENSILDGSEFHYMRKKHKTIPVPFYVKYENSLGYDYLQQVLNVKEPKELTFSIYPNRVFYAVPSGDLDFDEVRLNGKGTITFIVVDGLAHSKTTRTFEFTKNEQGVLEAEIENNGSEEVTVNYEIKLKKESGFIGIVSEYGAMQFGKYDESDGYMDRKNVTVVSNQKGDFVNWTDGTKNYENTNKIVTTKMTADKSYGGRLGLLSSSFKTSGTSGAFQYGAVKEYTLSNPISQWYIWARAWFETGLIGQTGAWCLTVLDEKNHLIAGMAIEKDDTVGNTAYVRFLMGDGSGGSRVVKTIDFTPSYWVPPNPYGTESRNQNRNMFDLVKEKDRVQFFWYGGYYPYYDSRLANVKAKKIQFFVGQYAGRNTTDRKVTHHYLNDFTFQELHVDYWKDVPNRYPSWSTIAIDGENGQIKVNNQIRLDDEILGTTYFKVPPGKTKVQLLVSSFAEVESATATIQEVYI
ncbi:phage tail protein [Streptococcus gallolyticus]|uniref:Phage tail protein n=1 Tax=Streptococcus gallolyticus TaxID=315405 RepID=A0A368UBF5_9STRE|nr:distal tail protein Dit [Streptococcus gallolyticus]RCW16318.1 phage tail protein [Streptococcus gallolyticus]